MTPQLTHFAVCAKITSDGFPQILHFCCFIGSRFFLIVPTLQRGSAVWTLQRPRFAKITDNSRPVRIPGRLHQAKLSA